MRRIKVLDVYLDFTSDTPGYWDDFWTRRNGLCIGKLDPDTFSPTLREYHKILWSRDLQNGEHMVLEDDPSGYLMWNGMRFGSDNIAASFRYEILNRVLILMTLAVASCSQQQIAELFMSLFY